MSERKTDPAALVALLERLGVLALLVAALVPRARDLGGSFDREIEGFQGAFFAQAAINYQRLGVDALGGYPVLNIDLPRVVDADGREVDVPAAWLAYANHPPTMPLLAWAALRVLGPDGWDQAWREGRAPEGVEAPLRLPFLVLHVLALAAFWACVREGLGSATAMIALALAATAPVLVHYGYLVNYENPALPFVFAAVGSWARYARTGSRRALSLFALASFGGSCITYMPLCFLPPLVAAALLRRRVARAAVVAVVGGVAGLLPLALHAAWAARALQPTGAVSAGLAVRAQVLLEPLLDGSAPLSHWFSLQAERVPDWIGTPLAVAAGLGLVLAVLRKVWPSLRGWLDARALGADDRERVDVATPLAAGGLVAMLAFYRHTLDPQHDFYLWIAPGLCALAAVAVDAVGRATIRLRLGFAPVVLLALALALPGLAAADRLRARHRAPLDANLPAELMPEIALPGVAGRAIGAVTPPRSVVLHPRVLGLNVAYGFYAWRTLLPLEHLPSGWPEFLPQRFGLGDAPRWVALPDEAPASIAPVVDSMRVQAGDFPGAPRSASGWSAWQLP